MRLRGTLTDRGMTILSKGFLPMLEKCGKTCQVLLSPDEVVLIQTQFNTDGIHACARFSVETLFDPATYKCQSRHFNLIAFQAEVGLLLRVLKGAAANDAELVEVKLTTKRVTPQGGEPQLKPFLSFTATGASLHMVLDVPTTKPYSPADIDTLVAAKDTAYCPFYLDLMAGVHQVQSIVDRLKGLDDAVLLATSKSGDAHLLVETTGVALGVQLRDLPVYPQDVKAQTLVDRSQPSNHQLQKALEAGEAVYVHVQLKHLARILQARAFTEPAQLLCGIATGGSHVHVLLVFRDPSSTDVFDDKVTLNFSLPVREQG